MPGCAIGKCGRQNLLLPAPGLKFANGRWHCYLCYIMPTLFDQPARSGATPEGKPQENPTRDGDPKLAAERKRGDLAFTKRSRAGPMWIPRERRVE